MKYVSNKKLTKKLNEASTVFLYWTFFDPVIQSHSIHAMPIRKAID